MLSLFALFQCNREHCTINKNVFAYHFHYEFTIEFILHTIQCINRHLETFLPFTNQRKNHLLRRKQISIVHI